MIFLCSIQCFDKSEGNETYLFLVLFSERREKASGIEFQIYWVHENSCFLLSEGFRINISAVINSYSYIFPRNLHH